MNTTFRSPYRHSRGTAGFTFIEMIIVVTIVGLLVAIGVPSYIRSRDGSRLNYIYSNLRTIEHAKEEWALDTHQPNGAAVPSMTTLTNYFRGQTIKDAVRETYVPNSLGVGAQANLPSDVNLLQYGPGATIPAP